MTELFIAIVRGTEMLHCIDHDGTTADAMARAVAYCKAHEITGATIRVCKAGHTAALVTKKV